MIKFGTSGIRDLTANLLKDNAARKLAFVLSKLNYRHVNIGRDGRAGSAELAEDFISAFGGRAEDYGITTTPAMAALKGLSVMVTASHNPAEYCGFKLCVDGKELDNLDWIEAELNAGEPPPAKRAAARTKPRGTRCSAAPYLPADAFDTRNCVAPYLPADAFDTRRCAAAYWGKAKGLAPDIVIDCANGALGYRLKQLGCKNIINFEGEINAGCGATHPENIEKYCKANGLEIGFAVDGDADRVIMFLRDRVLDGNELGFLLASLLPAAGIVADETMNFELRNHFNVKISKVGGDNILALMDDKFTLGMEKSGHYYFDREVCSSDALDAILLITEKYKEIGAAGLSAVIQKYHPYFQWNKNVKLTELRSDWERHVSVGEGIRAVVRKSGTEPLLRIMLEGKDRSAVEDAAKRLLDSVKQ